MFTELAENGSLYSYLHGEDYAVDSARDKRWMGEIAEGMSGVAESFVAFVLSLFYFSTHRDELSAQLCAQDCSPRLEV